MNFIFFEWVNLVTSSPHKKLGKYMFIEPKKQGITGIHSHALWCTDYSEEILDKHES